MSAARIWFEAARPKTLPAALAPVAMGIAIAIGEQSFHWLAAMAALMGALAIQIGTNYANDLFDHHKGADDEARLGPRRAVQAQLVSPSAMRTAALIAFGLALLPGAYLVERAGWPLVVLGLLCIALGVLYTGGPRPLGYVGLGDVLVLIFFGPVAVAGTHYVQSLEFSWRAVAAGLGPGLLSTALLAVNNLRDVAGDALAGKRTLAVRFGRGFARAEFVLCLLGAALVPVWLVTQMQAPTWVLLASAVTVSALPVALRVWRSRPGDRLLDELSASGRLLVLYASAFVVGWLA